jgi:hypothetical protein
MERFLQSNTSCAVEEATMSESLPVVAATIEVRSGPTAHLDYDPARADGQPGLRQGAMNDNAQLSELYIASTSH